MINAIEHSLWEKILLFDKWLKRETTWHNKENFPKLEQHILFQPFFSVRKWTVVKTNGSKTIDWQKLAHSASTLSFYTVLKTANTIKFAYRPSRPLFQSNIIQTKFSNSTAFLIFYFLAYQLDANISSK